MEARFDKIDAQIKKLYRLCNKIRTHQVDPDGKIAEERSKNSWFNKPQKVSPKLAKFLKIAETEEISRSEVSKRFGAYVKEKNLKNPENKSEILLDKTLKTLLSPEKDATVTHLNITKYINKHYVKDEAK